MNWRFLPNLITLLRVILLVPLTYYLIKPDYKTAVILFFIAGFSDAVDGYLAKKYSWVSRFGSIMDPLADKALLVITLLILTLNEQVSWLLFGVVVFRDILIILGALYYHWRLGPYEMMPSYLSKLNTFIQLLLVTSLLVSLGYRSLPEIYLEILIGLTFFTTISSGLHYIWVWSNKMKLALSQKS